VTVRTPYLSCWGLTFALALPCASAQESRWRELPLEVSPERLAIAAGLEPPVERWRLLYDVSSRIHPASGGQQGAGERLAAVASELARSRSEPASRETLLVPVPLTPDLWREALLDRPVSDLDLTRAVLLERSASLVYRGLCQMDPETLAFFAGHPGLLKRARLQQPEILALVAGSLHVRGGGIALPGGEEAAPLWQDVVGARATQPEEFLQHLLGHEEGRLALLLHAVQLLDPAQQRFALGLTIVDPGRRGARFRALAAAFARSPRWWQAQLASPSRALFDPAAVLGRVAVSESGTLAPPAVQAFWEAAFADTGSAPSSAALAAAAPVDAAWLAERIGLLPTPLARSRMMQIGFAQRAFGRASPLSQAEALAVVRQVVHRPALVLVLERIGFEDPARYAEVLSAAERLEALPGRHERARGLAQFAGALAVIDRARLHAVLDPPAAQALVVSLSRLRPPRLGYWDAFASWLDRELVPALAAAVGEREPLGVEEDVWLRALAGARATARPAPTFDWEGMPTRAEPATGERLRLAKVRRRQGGHSLDVALALARLARTLAVAGDRGPALAGLHALSLEPYAYPEDEEAPAPAAILRAAAAGRPRDLLRFSDAVLADTLVALAYAPHLGPADGAVLSGTSVARRHDFGERPFALPQQVAGGGAPWHVQGSLLALEVALAPLSLRRMTPEVPARPPVCDAKTLASFALSSALRSPFAMRDADAAAAAAAIERGRARVRGLLGDASLAAAVARDAQLEPWRAQALPWLLAHEPAALSAFFSLAELLRLGGPVPLPDEAWGLPDLALGGGLRLRRPDPALLGRSQGQDRRELAAAALEDPLLKVATELVARRLPACLAPATLALLTQSIADDGPAELPEDPSALVRFLHALPSERFDDYVSSLAGDGPLLPAEAVVPAGAP
jgi:hypothetical protein